ncbi:nuclear transport factor 2 family protein [Massilia luteola]|uniref:nuclear transport factor 2 family protein n=1 Tax=Massilia luteola TaxID=3081751 RepID=UPI002ACC2F1E|nr:nuclear transport factor 2 family protein [Massilia sp. Gc5]
MPTSGSPEAVIQRQLDAYNARDLDALLATYAPDARQYELPATLLATGHAEMRPRFAARFQEPDLHAHLLQRAVMGNIVIDYETVTRNFPEGRGKVDLVAIYDVVNGLIRSQTVQVSNQRLDAQAD